MVALAVGARRSELLALNWPDVDLAGGLLSISKAMCQITGSVPFVKGTKTGARRSVPLAEIALQALLKQRARQAAERLKAGALYRSDPSEPVFTNAFGDRLTPRAATTVLLGHANASFTLNVYGHVLGDGLRAATDRLGAA